MSLYPNIPNVPGVPPIPRNPLAPIPLPTLLTGDVFNAFANPSAQQWGLFLDGDPVIFADTISAFDFRQDWELADYQIEQGGFETYDKVQRPYDVRLTFVQGGSESDRATFIQSILDIVDDTNLYDVQMPENSWSNLNVVHWDFKRESDNGLGLFRVNLYLREARANVTQQFSNSQTSAATAASPVNPTATQDPGSNAFVDNGVLQAAPVATLQPPVSASSAGATGIAGDPAATAAPVSLSPTTPVTTNVPLMTPANQNEGFHYGTAPSLLDGSPAQPIQAATQNTYTLDQFSGGTKIYNPTTATSTVIPAGQAPQALGFH